MDLLVSDAQMARSTLGDRAVVERASFEDITVLLGEGEAHA